MRYTLFLSATNYGLAPQALSKNFILQTAGLYSHCSAALTESLSSWSSSLQACEALESTRSHLRAPGTQPHRGCRWADSRPPAASLHARCVGAEELSCDRPALRQVAGRGGQALGQGHVTPPNICLSVCTHSCVFGVGLYSSNSSTTGHTELHGTEGRL